MLELVAALDTSTIRVEVNEYAWDGPNERTFIVERPTITLVLTPTKAVPETTYRCATTSEAHSVGRLMFVPCYSEIHGRSERAGRVKLVSCSFDPDHFRQAVRCLPHLPSAPPHTVWIVHSQLAPALLSRLMSEVLQPSPMRQAVADSIAQTLLVECWHAIHSQQEVHVRGRLTPRHFRIIDEYLTGLQYEAPSVAAIARACGLSVRHLARLFRQQTDLSIGRYLRSAQIAKAKMYLLESELSLKEIAYRLGFSAPSNFYAAFRSVTGQTPTQFRLMNRDYAGPHVTHAASDFAHERHPKLQ